MVGGSAGPGREATQLRLGRASLRGKAEVTGKVDLYTNLGMRYEQNPASHRYLEDVHDG